VAKGPSSEDPRVTRSADDVDPELLAVARARALFLDDDHGYGCAETTLIVLQEVFGRPDATNAAAAMALNGGVAYGGGICGALTGAAVAVGQLVGSGDQDRRAAKRTAREIVGGLTDAFEAEFGAVDCRALLARDIRSPEAHAAFIESGIWRTACMRQIEFVVRRLARPVSDPTMAPPVRVGRRQQRGDPRAR
jgi:C_GCAxxG_C_C family probable redox protein